MYKKNARSNHASSLGSQRLPQLHSMRARDMERPDTPETTSAYNFKSQQLYESLPLPSQTRSIRLLDLEHDERDLSAPLRGTLRLANLDQSPSYTALSYVWGPWSSPRDTISCNGCQLEIARNCYEALRSLRKVSGAITIWVDAICINQNELHTSTSDHTTEGLREVSEKISQMKLMGDIYTYAQPAYIWLGPGSDATDRAMSAIKLLARHRVLPGAIPWFPSREKITVRGEKIEMLWNVLKVYSRRLYGSSNPIPPSLNERLTMDDLKSLLQSEWLQRTWTFQELVLASRPMIVCGDQYCERAEFYQGVVSLHGGVPAVTGRLKGCSFQPPLACGTLPLDILIPWRDLMSFYEVIPRPKHWYKHDLRVLSSSDWTVAKQESLFTQSALKRSILLVEALLLGLPGILLLCAIIVSTIKISTLQGYWKLFILLEGVPLACFIGVLIIAYNNSHMHIGPDGDVLSPIWEFPYCRATEKIRKVKWYRRSLPTLVGVPNRQFIAGLGRMSRYRLATDPKDKYFGVQGIIQRLGFEDEDMFGSSSSLGETYLRLYKWLLYKDKRALNLLLDAGGGSLPRDQSKVGTPSWVPDWKTLDERAWLPDSYVYDAIRNGLNEHKPRYAIFDTKLHIHGVLRGTVTHCSKAIPIIPADDGQECFITDSTEISRSEIEPPSPPRHRQRYEGGDAAELISTMRILFGMVLAIRRYRGDAFAPDSSGWTAVQESISLCAALFAHLIPMKSSYSRDPDFWDTFSMCFFLWWEQTCLTFFVEGGEYSEESMQAKIEDFVLETEEQRYFLRRCCCDEVNGKRGFFFTDSGLVGTGPPDTAEGDVIANIVGVTAPLVLRKVPDQEDCYQVIGPAYVDMLVAWCLDLSDWHKGLPRRRGLFPSVLEYPDPARVSGFGYQRVYQDFGYEPHVEYPTIVLV